MDEVPARALANVDREPNPAQITRRFNHLQSQFITQAKPRTQVDDSKLCENIDMRQGGDVSTKWNLALVGRDGWRMVLAIDSKYGRFRPTFP